MYLFNNKDNKINNSKFFHQIQTSENKRYQNVTLQKHIVDHDNLIIHSAYVPTIKNINRLFSAN
jgi:hypothetical protein